jgi:hypothetical protein
MAFQRNHVSDAERLGIGLHVFRYKSGYGVVTNLARKYMVSRWFIYYCYLQFLLLLDIQKEWPESLTPRYGHYESLEERVLSLYLDTEASLSGVRRVLNNLFGQEVCIGRISEIINDYGRMLESSETVTCRVKLICDEIFIGSPILVTVEPSSGYILSLELVESRDKETWGACWIELVDNETGYIERIIADQAKGLLGGIELLFEEHGKVKLVFQGDMFHLIMRLVAGIRQAKRKAYAAIEKEYDALNTFERAKRERVLHKRLKQDETAHGAAEQWMQWYDDSLYLFRELQEVLRIVDMETGELRRKAEVIADVDTILALLEHEIGAEKIQKGARYIRTHHEALLHYFDEVEVAAEELNAAIAEREVRHAMFRLYACQQQMYTAYGQRKRGLQAYKAALEHSLSDRLGEAEYRRVYHRVEQTLSSIIRSSSMVENTNSRLRRFFDSARSQINQNRLNLIRFYLNHKPFERGEKRRGKTAAQLFHGDEASSEHWLSVLRAKKAQQAAVG